MQYFVKNIAFTCLFLLTQYTHAQFLGGDGDGYMYSETGITSVNEQLAYCQGGESDGYSLKTLSTTINFQEGYCVGGNGDGYENASSGLIVQFDQTFYCSGGLGDGFNTATSGSIIQFDQAFYCSGGSGDGHNLLSSGIFAQNNQSIYCSGGDGDGYYQHSSGMFIQNEQNFYCSGGDGDGYSKYILSDPINEQVFYCDGGIADGSTFLSTGILTANDASFYCAGGDADGYGRILLASTVNEQSLYCTGYSGDGYYMQSFNAAVNDQNFYCSGGNADGYHFNFFNGDIFGDNLFCIGGDGDGYQLGSTLPAFLGVGIWEGTTNPDWNTNTNWTHNIVPTFSDNVLIPAGCANYPVVGGSIGVNYYTGSVRCSGLTIEQGASLTNSGYLYLAGNMLIEGNYTNNYYKTRSQRIHAGGLMRITETGSVVLGNQTTINGLADLLINDGGTVILDGGFLQVDDQLHIRSGGTLNMTGGELVVHKYGEGTSFRTYNPCNFWIEAGAMGEMSGGFVRVSGRETDGIFVAVRIGEPTFLFSGTHTLVLQHGDNPIHFDPGISTADGVSLQNLTINKPGNTTYVLTNLDVKGELKIQSGSNLELESSTEISVGE